ncbi:inositol monophosphatase [Pusillimonas sp. CC-YST705]|uniref:Inositol-1-monophosphatase n=1 Tax=Mesopusillimonas faecipullorum TaxID=2755040 RepID=A0ABS8C976_9BURK|nr:inositol monophosphatase family protein [Mesopusillimonas faecipullorum]MCB5362583.1 inositol monophosphatase [Mesopusillimonas faecipullorum]
MLPSPLHLSEYLNCAISAARAGAAILQTYAHQQRDALVIDEKALNDLVSQADREAEQSIVEVLQAGTPQFDIIAEESGKHPVGGQATWYIDPLDGTTNFLHGIPHYAVSIGLIAQPGSQLAGQPPFAQETPVLAIVYDPCREELFTAMYGVGAWLNEHRIHCSATPSLSKAVLATGFPFRDFSFADQYQPMLNAAMRRTRGIRRMGAAALDLAWVACGRFDGYWEMGLAPWDVAAGTLLVQEAGGVAADMRQQHSWPIKGELYAGNPQVADELLALITPHLR